MTLIVDPIVTLRPGTARSDRWQPTRAGIINLWRYWDETFSFHNGRLLLRGPNGSGKSMALELLLPFLLDGDASPAKLTSAAKSRGGLLERVMTGSSDSTRTGFAWIEFRRADQTFTVGARMRGSSSTRTVGRSLFTTTQTIGSDLDLLDDARVPLSRKALDEAIGPHGRMTDSAGEHRDAIRAVLYPEFSADRYDALVNALLALRKEKLSQHLDLDKLDEVMSEALPAMDDHEIAAVAEGFERLDRRRDELALLEHDVNEIESLARRQRAYARAVVAALADEVRKAESARDGIVRRQRLAADDLEGVEAELRNLDAEAGGIRERLQSIGGELDGLTASELYAEGALLAELRRDLDGRVAEREHLAEDLRQRQDDLTEATAGVRSADHELSAAVDDQAVAERELMAAADLAGAGPTVAEMLAGVAPDGASLVGAWVRARRAGMAEIRRLGDDHGRAVERRVDAEARLEERRQRVDELTGERGRATAALDAARAEFVSAVRQWTDSSVSLNDGWRERIRRSLDDPAGPTAGVARAVTAISSEQASELAVARAAIDARRSVIVADRVALVAERSELERGRLPVVAAPGWRSARPQDRPGAPLWQLVDVIDGADEAMVDGVESAMVAAGLADAWVAPSGSFDLPEGLADIVVTAPDERPGGRTLFELLRPAADDHHGVPPAVVETILASIPLRSTASQFDDAVAEVGLVLGTDRTFRIGTAVGRGASGSAVLLGAAARQRHRRAEIGRLTELVADCDRRLQALESEERRLTIADGAFSADVDAVPSPAPCDGAATALGDAEVRLGEADSGRRAAEAVLTAAESAVRTTQRSLATRAATLGIPADDAGLAALAGAVDAVERAGGAWNRRTAERATAEKQRGLVEQGRDRAERAAAAARARWHTAAAATAVVSAKVEAIDSTVGQEFGALMDRIGELEAERRRLDEAKDTLAARRPSLDRRHGKLEGALAEANEDLDRAENDRQAVHRRFVDLFTGPLPNDAGLDSTERVLDGVTAVLGRARALGSELDGVPTEQKQLDHLSLRLERQLHDTRAAVGNRLDLDRHETDQGWYVLRGSTGGIRRGLVDLRAHLGHQLAEARSELEAQEAELFERTLAGSIRHALADRIRAANALVAGINEQLSAVQTAAAGVAVRLRWDVHDDQPDAMRTARALLLRDPADLIDSEREALQDFVRARVDQARAELDLHAPWEARLRESLDYRVWHRFSLQISHRDWEGFRPATGRLLQRLSTGERSVALHLPMLASIAAHYTGGDGEPGSGPRLILLDELFAGVDAANRAQLFGTFTSWDLDAVLTSDHEWCQYASLDGIAIHHLQGGGDDEPVTSTRFTWDGSTRRLDHGTA